MKTLSALIAVALVLSGCGYDSVVDEPATVPTETTVTTADQADTTTTTEEDDIIETEGQTAADGDTVAVHYRGTLDDGSEFDSSEGRDPLTFAVGSGEVIAGFDDAVRGLTVGESRTVRIEPEGAYGDRTDEAVIEFPAESAPEGLSVGDQVTLGNGLPATVLAISDDTVTIDANHPLAGEALTFEIELVSIDR